MTWFYVYKILKTPLKEPKNKKQKLDLSNEFGKVPGYKINIQQSVACLYTNNEWPEKK